MTGTGKTVFGGWVESRQRFNERPWVNIDFKQEVLWDKVGDPPMRPLGLNTVPKKPGLFRLEVTPRDNDALEDWLWKVWERGNIGIFCDEVSLIPQKEAFKAILRQGRSKRIPVISCTQRPVDCDREVFSEANYVSIFRVKDRRDYKIIQEFTGNAAIEKPLPDHWSYWYDARQNHLFTLQPCPPPDMVAKALRDAAPYSFSLFG
jgi:hypothetical protein